jgi:PadR family transcriptional regulator PadR
MDITSQWLVQLRKGVVELLVLRLLASQGELHGYAIVKELLSLGRLVAGESTVYPVLKRLESDALLSARWVEAEGGPPRKYYALTEAGWTFLDEAGREWDALVDSMSRVGGPGSRGAAGVDGQAGRDRSPGAAMSMGSTEGGADHE